MSRYSNFHFVAFLFNYTIFSALKMLLCFSQVGKLSFTSFLWPLWILGGYTRKHHRPHDQRLLLLTFPSGYSGSFDPPELNILWIGLILQCKIRRRWMPIYCHEFQDWFGSDWLRLNTNAHSMHRATQRLPASTCAVDVNGNSSSMSNVERELPRHLNQFCHPWHHWCVCEHDCSFNPEDPTVDWQSFYFLSGVKAKANLKIIWS